MLKIYTILYRIAILIAGALYILLMFATSSGGYGSHPNIIDIALIGIMLLIFVILTVFQNIKEGNIKTFFRYLSAVLVGLIAFIFTYAMITAELSVELLLVYIIFSTLSGLLLYELVSKRK